jgi:hypothetical protein
MRPNSSRTVLAGLSAAAGAFAAAAMVSGAIAPAAHADDASEILAAVQADEAAASADFTAASQALAGGETGLPTALTDYFEGIDNDFYGVAYDESVGTLDEAYNVPVFPTDSFVFTITQPTISDYVSEAQTVYTQGMTYETDVANFQAEGDWTDAALNHGLAQMDLLTIPDQIQIIGELEQIVALIPGF